MTWFEKFASRLSDLGGIAAGVILVYVTAHITTEIVLRSCFSSTTYTLDEFVSYSMLGMTFLTLGYALKGSAMIRVNLLVGRLHGRRRQVVEVFSVLATLAVVLFLFTYFCRTIFFRDLARGAVSESIARTPMWIPEGMVFLGLVIFIAQLIAYLIHVVRGGEPLG